MSNNEIKSQCSDITLIPIEVAMRDQMPERIKEENVNIFFNLHPFDGTHWVLVIKNNAVY